MKAKRKLKGISDKGISVTHVKEVEGTKTTITLALETEVLEKIRLEAKDNSQSVNALINRILEKYVLLYGPAEQERSMIVPNKTMRFFLDNIEEQMLADDYTNFCLDYVKSYYVARNIPITLDNVIKYCYKVLAMNGGSYHEFRHYVDEDGFVCLVFTHSYGMKWSRIMSRGFSKQLEVYLGLQAERELFDNTVVLKIRQ